MYKKNNAYAAYLNAVEAVVGSEAEDTPRKLATATQPQFPRTLISLELHKYF
jgi:hypothetical protein